MRIDIVTTLPEMFAGPFDHGVVGRARAAGILDIRVHDLRHWTDDPHRTTDDYAFGGGGGMVMKPEPLFRAVEDLLSLPPITAEVPRPATPPIVVLSPGGQPFDDALARELAKARRLVLLCGRYEGCDERVHRHLATHEVSVGDFVVSGGEIPAMLVADAVARLQPGVVGQPGATDTDSFAAGLLEHPHYTRPADFRGFQVPPVLLSGDHAAVASWRRREALRRTQATRADLLATAELDEQDRRWLAEDAPPG